MAIPAIVAFPAGAGFLVADATAPVYGTTNGILIGVGGAIIVALITAGAQVWSNKRRNRTDDPRPTSETRLATLEANVATMQRRMDENHREVQRRFDQIEEHVRPWPDEKHHR